MNILLWVIWTVVVLVFLYAYKNSRFEKADQILKRYHHRDEPH